MAEMAAILDFRLEQFLIYKSTQYFLRFRFNWHLGLEEEAKIDFQDASYLV